ncbi:MAG: hypothetical protein AVDCRST_MAG66-2503 [uncultured Pseudonocardia sp.]|uniref:Uncharacterized protein n=1 Tax=uncultured Pseudonocardia sp. TaxID=211455 RepID=A0A6J4PSE6_9PSEU|nr:MAG: hypothetical protein AVDCRST_MAG66-2503 [uncultured Pseudonocardia sp.]
MSLHPLLRRLVVVGAPAVLAGLMVFHSVPGAFAGVDGLVTFIELHMVMLVLFALTAWAGWLLLDGVTGADAAVARLALGLFVPFYAAYDGMLGIARSLVYIRAEQTGGAEGEVLTAAARSLGGYSATGLVVEIGTWAWIVGVLGLAVTVARTRRQFLPAALLVPAAVALYWDHPAPAGTIAFGSFALAALWLELRPAGRPRAAGGGDGLDPVAQPGLGQQP